MKKTLLAVGVVGVLVPALSFAAYVKTGRNVSVAEAISDNVYVAGGNVTVSGSVQGDLLAAGGYVFVTGKVGRDIMVGGGNVTLASITAEDVRAVGGQVSVGGTLVGELMAAAGEVTVLPGTAIAKDSYIAAGTLNFNGSVAGSLTVRGGAVYINGTVEKDLTIPSGKNVTLGPNAVVKGSFTYTSPSEATIEQGARIVGETTFHKATSTAATSGARAGVFAGIFSILLFVKTLATLVFAYLLWYTMRKDVVAAVVQATSHFGRELLRGFIFLVVAPAAIIVAFITVIGFLPGIAAGLLYAALLILATPITIILVASLFMKRRTDLRWYHILLGAAVLLVVGFVPFLGWLAVFVVYLAALGALLNVLRLKFRRGE